MSKDDFEGTEILEKLAAVGELDAFLEAVDSDDLGEVIMLLNKVKIDPATIQTVIKMMSASLAAAETAFRFSGMNNFQIQFTKNQHALPITRNYMISEDEMLREVDSKRPRFKSVTAE